MPTLTSSLPYLKAFTFPKQQGLIAKHLRNDPLITRMFATDDKIIQAAISYFQGREATPESVQTAVKIICHVKGDLKKVDAKVVQEALKTSLTVEMACLAGALEECAIIETESLRLKKHQDKLENRVSFDSSTELMLYLERHPETKLSTLVEPKELFEVITRHCAYKSITHHDLERDIIYLIDELIPASINIQGKLISTTTRKMRLAVEIISALKEYKKPSISRL